MWTENCVSPGAVGVCLTVRLLTPGLYIFFQTHLTYSINLYISIDSLYPNTKSNTILSNGCLGSSDDEERSKMRYVMRIAEFSESSNLWTHIALSGTTPGSTPFWVSILSKLGGVLHCSACGRRMSFSASILLVKRSYFKSDRVLCLFLIIREND